MYCQQFFDDPVIVSKEFLRHPTSDRVCFSPGTKQSEPCNDTDSLHASGSYSTQNFLQTPRVKVQTPSSSHEPIQFCPQQEHPSEFFYSCSAFQSLFNFASQGSKNHLPKYHPSHLFGFKHCVPHLPKQSM